MIAFNSMLTNKDRDDLKGRFLSFVQEAAVTQVMGIAIKGEEIYQVIRSRIWIGFRF